MTTAIVYLLVTAVIVPTALSLLEVQFDWLDVAIISVGHAAAALVPEIGGPLSLLLLIGLLKWRCRDASMFELGAAVVCTRLLLVPALMLVR